MLSHKSQAWKSVVISLQGCASEVQDGGAPIASSAKRRGENNWKGGTEGEKILWPIPHILNNNLGVKPTENGAQGMTRYFSQYLMS